MAVTPNHDSGRLGPLVYLSTNPISMVGVFLVTTAAVAWFFTLPLQFGPGDASPYIALLTFIALPAIFFVGLVLIPIGIRRTERKKRSEGVYPSSFPPLSWANPEFRKLASFILLATAANVIIGGNLTYSAVEYMDSTSFCGQACHIMEPEFTAYQFAPHSEIGCTECHIGEGAGSFIQAKLNGAKQLVEVLTNTYPTPVPTPVHNLAQGNLTCGECHSERDLETKRKEWFYFAEDESNSATRTELLLSIGGGDNPSGAHGAHFSGDAVLEYRSDPKRRNIEWIRYVAPDGRETIYQTADYEESSDLELRTMDCTDCHNRAAHSFEDPSRALDRALAERTIDPDLPYIKREALAAVTADYSDRDTAAREIPQRIAAFYQGRDVSAPAVEAAGLAAAAVYARNIFPEFAVDWGVHPNQLGHTDDAPGCFRCHNEQLVSQDADRRPIGDDCAACHVTLAEGQPVSAPTATLTSVGRASDRIAEMSFSSSLGAVGFDHAQHVDYEQGDCTACHNAVFPMSRAPLRYGGADLHQAAEEAKSSCASCHVEGGSAFAAVGNCDQCHTNLSEPRTVLARAPSQDADALPGLVRYATSLGEAEFDHAQHVQDADGDCTACHNTLFPMKEGVALDYGGADAHRAAEAAKTSCAGCHVTGGSAFAAAGECSKCHVGLGEPRPTPNTGLSGIPGLSSVETRLGDARFDHEKHVELAEGDCTQCHNKIFPLAKGLLNYKDNLHRTAESEQTSCGACHRPGGTAFEAEGNCLDCHSEPSTTERGSLLGLPEALLYPNRLGDVAFDHDQHIAEANGECADCHNELWPMKEAGLEGYADDYHRDAEASRTSCASCHHEDGSSFGSLNSCTRCHEGLEIEGDPRQPRRKAGIAFPPWALLFLLAFPSGLFAQTGGYVGSERCAVCHKEEAEAFDTNPHAASSATNAWEDRRTLCESCHGPGLEHVEALDPAPLAVFAEGQPHRVNQSCLECHGEQSGQAFASVSGHSRNGVACTACHSVHGPQAESLLAAKQGVLCEQCHTDVKLSFNRPFRHKLHEGAIACVDCHDPHGQAPPAQLVRVAGTEETCLNCHADKRGPFPFEHAPVRLEACSTCHEPHGSANPRMLTRHTASQLCLECHTTTLATLGGSPPAFHDLRTARFRNCTTCHSKIHGSFVSRDFLR